MNVAILDSTARLYLRVVDKSPAEIDYHLRAAWTGNRMRRIIANTYPLRDIEVSDRSTVSDYADDKIVLTARSTNDPVVLRHEYGHAIDFNGKKVGKSAKLYNVLVAEGERIEPTLELVDEFDPTRSDALHFADWVGALTDNRVGYGHASSYYQTDRLNRCYEAFANFVALTEGPGGVHYRARMGRLAPRLCDGFDAILNKVA